MEEERKKYPSLPSNYVTLVQLRERWVKEQQKKQIQKERQEQEEDDQRLINEQDKQKHKEDEKRPETHYKSITRRRNSSSYDHRTIAVRHLAPKGPEDQPQTEAETKAVVVVGEEIHEQDRNSDESKKKKKKKRQKNWRGKPKREEEVTGGTELPAPENMEEENILVRRDDEEEEKILVRRDDERKGLHGGLNIWVRRDGERKGMRGELRYKNKTVVKGKVSEPDDHLTMEIGQKFEDLSINCGKEEGKDRSRVERNVGLCTYRGSGRFSLRGERIRKPRDSGLVWVKKEEISNGNVAGIQYPQQNHRRNQSSLIGIASFAE